MDRKIIRSTGVGMMASALFIFGAGALTEEAPEAQSPLQENEMIISTDEYESLQNEIAGWEDRMNQIESTDETPNEEITRMILSVESGMTSPDISSALYQNGLIPDESAFNDYLADQGLTDRIQIGEYDLNSTMTIEQMAKLITQ
ncbi:hypothetical protein [Jeotgalibacillus malaysiensis]|uniref:hypothetical protein n=1 Tax=Jeotgalibacillus malaysiensis TaxID=1508404 RepID=UPI0038506872